MEKLLKRLKEIEKRKREIRLNLEGTMDIEDIAQEVLDEIQTELEGLQDEEEQLKKRQKTLSMLESGKVGGAEFRKPNENAEITAENVLETAEYRQGFFKKLQGKRLNEIEERAMTTAANSVGAVVPTETLNKIIERLRDYGVVFPLVSQLNIPSKVEIPFEGVTADLSWKAEGASSTDSNDTTDKLSLSAYKLIKTITITAEVEAMSIDAFEEFIVAQLSNKIKKAIDNAIINGTGSSQATGILKAITAVGVTEADKLGYDDILDLIAELPDGYAQNAKFMMHRKTLYKRVAKIKDDVKQPIFKPETDGKFRGNVLGYPVVTYDNIPEDKIIFGDFEYYYFNIVKAFEIAIDTSVAFKSGDTCYRALGLCDGDVALDEAFVVADISKKKPAESDG